MSSDMPLAARPEIPECQKQLEDAEGRVEILLKKADGKLAAEPFDPEQETES